MIENNKMIDKKILITGSEGLIGSELMRHFPNVHGIDKGDEIPEERFDIIIHTAANCVIREIIKNPNLAKENIDFTFEVMEKARKDKSDILLFSSGRVTGEEIPYTTSKKFLEDMALAYKNCYNLRYVIIRPETVWGREEKNRRVINTWIDSILEDKPVVVYGDKDKELSPIHVKEFADIFMNIFNNFEDSLYKTLSITGQPRKVGEIINAIATHHNKTPKTEFKEPELTQPQRCDVEGKIIGKILFEEQLRL